MSGLTEFTHSKECLETKAILAVLADDGGKHRYDLGSTDRLTRHILCGSIRNHLNTAAVRFVSLPIYITTYYRLRW